MLILPDAPEALTLSIGRLWDGSVQKDASDWALIHLQKTEEGITLRARLRPALGGAEAALFVYIGEEGGQLLEIRITEKGEIILSGYDEKGQRVSGFEERLVAQSISLEGGLEVHACIPFDFFPTHPACINVVFACGGKLYAYHPLPSQELPHTTESFPFLSMPEGIPDK